MRRTLRALSVVLAITPMLPLLSACGGGGSKSDTAVTNTTVSKGQALIDLKKAHDSGAMSDAEYQRERQNILNAK